MVLMEAQTLLSESEHYRMSFSSSGRTLLNFHVLRVTISYQISEEMSSLQVSLVSNARKRTAGGQDSACVCVTLLGGAGVIEKPDAVAESLRRPLSSLRAMPPQPALPTSSCTSSVHAAAPPQLCLCCSVLSA
jgi:hypothetical protein